MTTGTDRPVATMPPAFGWASQVRQYPKIGASGVSLFEGDLSHMGLDPVLCLCWRDEQGLLRGVLNYYTQDSPWEKKGNANLFVDPEWYGRGIGTTLLKEGIAIYNVDLHQQRYTKQGAAFVQRLIEKGEVTW